jgi:hypothetical protein
MSHERVVSLSSRARPMVSRRTPAAIIPPVRGRPHFFRETDVKTNCDACGVFFDLLKGGVCEKCRRILCGNHLHGSWTQRLIADITNRNVCVQCRHDGR